MEPHHVEAEYYFEKPKHEEESSGSFPIGPISNTEIEEDINEVDPTETKGEEEESLEIKPISEPSSDMDSASMDSASMNFDSMVSSGVLLPVSPEKALATLYDDWIKKKNTIVDTIMNTNMLISQLPVEAFNSNIDTIANILENAKDADGIPIFKNHADVVDYIYKIRNKNKQTKTNQSNNESIPEVPNRLEDDIRLENRYSRRISPLMNRSILSNTVKRSNLFAFQ